MVMMMIVVVIMARDPRAGRTGGRNRWSWRQWWWWIWWWLFDDDIIVKQQWLVLPPWDPRARVGSYGLGGNSSSQTRRPQTPCGWCWWCWCDVGRNGGGKNSSESDTQGPARWAKVPLSLQTKVDGTCKGVGFAKIQRRLQTRKRSEMELNRRGRLQAGGGKSTFEIEVDLLFIYTNIWSWVEPSSWSGQKDALGRSGECWGIYYLWLPSSVSFCQT